MKNQTPAQYYFDLIEKELKEYEKQILEKNRLKSKSRAKSK
tara:strand:+ start:6530 stop:6652 length:123 start_codon:yes stop_codon:yes gene_type:complete